MDLSKYDHFIFDCDGVIWHLDNPIPQAMETLNRLTELGKGVYFITNNSSATPTSIVNKLSAMGFSTQSSNVITASSITPFYLKTQYPNAQKLFLIGMPKFRTTLEEAGYTVIHISDFNFQPSVMYQEMKSLQVDREVDCVVVGYDTRFNYLAGMYASMCVQNGAAFIASNTDAAFVCPPTKLPGGGTLVAFMETALDRKPEICGKPYNYMFKALQKTYGIEPSRTLMVGDSLQTDVLFGKNSGLDTLLVESGVNRAEDIETLGIHPTFVLPSIAQLLK